MFLDVTSLQSEVASWKVQPVGRSLRLGGSPDTHTPIAARADLLNLQSAGIDLGDAEPSRREGASGRCSVSLLPAVSPL